MTTFTREITIQAPLDAVWATLADIGSIHQWNPNVAASHCTTGATEGLGATRHCDFGGRNYFREEVVAWAPGERLTMRVTKTNLPIDTADFRFVLRPQGAATVVAVSPVYRVKYGAIGRLLDRLLVRRQFEAGMEALLGGLKRHVEERVPA